MPTQQARNEAVADAVRNGTILKAVAEQHGITPERVRQIAANAGVISARGKVSSEKIAYGVNLFQRGMPISHAAEAIGVSFTTLYKRLVALGLHEKSETERFAWDDVADDMLRRFYNSYPGAARELADMLGTTRNSVIGRAHRLGLQKTSR